ncbi:hypothetical protein SAMN05444417_1809 [Wenxinia saemankumensis]|uniref:Uncharacterized protein n=1 Tax=Wenxinia saemankumensis TaxID=1447782 RepID=A0A1M6E598_9RHOB|nr:hypothetical protein SAMN05444417_1809 [Wenxinia saemankumensis]
MGRPGVEDRLRVGRDGRGDRRPRRGREGGEASRRRAGGHGPGRGSSPGPGRIGGGSEGHGFTSQRSSLGPFGTGETWGGMTGRASSGGALFSIRTRRSYQAA